MAIALGSGFADRDHASRFAGQQAAMLARQAAAYDALGDLLTPSPAGAQGAGLAASRALPAGPPNLAVPFDDVRLVQDTFSRVAARAPQVMEHLHALLFTRHPEMRAIFPLALDEHRDLVFRAIARLVWSMDRPDALTSQLRQIGLMHRKFGVTEKHLDPFLECLLAAVRHTSGDFWSAEAEAAWAGALRHAASAMLSAAAQDAKRQPAWWVGEVARHEQLGDDLAVLTVSPDRQLEYLAGQYVSVQVPRWPRVWRNFSIANAPRGSGLLDLHVRAVPGGMVSTSLVHHTRVGDTVLLGRARGEMTPPADAGRDTDSAAGRDADSGAAGSGRLRDMVCLAGGTGLAPIKAIIEAVIDASRQAGRGSGRPAECRRISLFVGARHASCLYDMHDLAILEAAYPALTVIPVVSDDPGFSGLRGTLPEVVGDHASCIDSEVYVSGPGAMVRECERVLARCSCAARVHADPPDAAR